MTEKTVISQDSDGLKKALDELGIGVRWNNSINDAEWNFPHEPNQDWRRLRVNDEGWLRNEICEKFVFVSDIRKSRRYAKFNNRNWEISLGAVYSANRYDPDS